MPATAAQVFGPNTVNPGFNSTGEKTLLTMSTTLAAGGKNVILFSYMENNAFQSGGAKGVFRIKKGATIIYETKLSEFLNFGGTRTTPKLLIAVDTTPAGNDIYTATVNITTAGTATGSVHVQAIVIKSDDAVWGYNATAVNIAAGTTATVTSISTAFPSGSKVAIIGVIYGGRSSGTGRAYMGIDSNRLKSGATIVASNEFNAVSFSIDVLSWVSLQYLETTATSSQIYSLEVSNGGTVQVTMYGIIVAFTVTGGAFLDTASVSLTSGSQVTVGNLSTTLVGDIAVIGLAAVNNPIYDADPGFNAGDVVLQWNNLATGQIANQVGWYMTGSTWPGILPLFRLDTAVSNPSYQIKMTARQSGINGEAKILAFSLGVIVTVSVSDGGVGVDSVSVSASVPVLDAGTGVEIAGLIGSIPASDTGGGVEIADLSVVVPVGDIGVGVEFIASGVYQPFSDTGNGVDEVVMLLKEVLDTGVGVELVDMAKGVFDTGVGTDIITSPNFNQLVDAGLGVDTPVITIPQSDAGIGIDIIGMVKEVLDTGNGIEEIPFLSKEVLDTGSGFDATLLVTSVVSHDFAVGTDVVGLVSVVQVIDAGVGAELAETQLSIYGVVTLDNSVIVGVHSIPYRDLARDGLPIQTQRRFVDDRVYVGGVEVGVVTVEWEDKVADIVPGVRTVRVAGVVRLVE